MKTNPLYAIIGVLVFVAVGVTMYFYSKIFSNFSKGFEGFGNIFGGDKETTDGTQTDTNDIEGDDDDDNTTVQGVPNSLIDSLATGLNDSITSWNWFWAKSKRSELFYKMVHDVNDSTFIAVCNKYKLLYNHTLREDVMTIYAPVHPPSSVNASNAWELLEVTIINRMNKLYIP